MSKQWTIENDTGAELIVRAPNGFAVELDANSADPRERFAYFAIRQQARDIAELETDVAGLRSSEAVLKFDCDQLRAKLAEMVGRSKASRDDLHRSLGRTDDTIIQLEHELSLSRLATERHKMHIAQCGEELKTIRADLAAAVAERDDYRDEFSGLCHTLSVGSEGRPEMTAADWRKRVDQGIEFLIRPLQERAERAEAELALAREHIARSDEHHQAAAIAMTENLRAEVIRLASKIVQLQKESK